MQSKYVNDFLLKVEDFSLSKGTIRGLVEVVENELKEKSIAAFRKTCKCKDRNGYCKEHDLPILCNDNICNRLDEFTNELNKE